MSSSLAKMMMPRAFGVSMSLLITLLNSPGFGSLGILMDWAIQTPPGCWRCQSQSFAHQGHRHTTVAGTESSKGNGACPQGAPSTLPTINPEPHLTACALTDGHSIGSFRPQTTPPTPRPGPKLTSFSRDLHKSLNPTLSVVALRGQRGHVVPSQCPHYVHHGLGLVGVGGHHAGEEVIACGVAELRGRGRVADLGDLEWGDTGLWMEGRSP